MNSPFDQYSQYAGPELRELLAIEPRLTALSKPEIKDLVNQADLEYRGHVLENVTYFGWEYRYLVAPKDGVYLLLGGPHRHVARVVILTRSDLPPKDKDSVLKRFIADCKKALKIPEPA